MDYPFDYTKKAVTDISDIAMSDNSGATVKKSY